jgi:hypothetical protein
MLRAITILAFTAAVGITLVSYSAPWEQVNPRDSTTVQRSLGFAPTWTHKFENIPGAQVDSDQFAVYMFVVLTIAILAGVWAYIVLGTPFWRQPPPPKPIIRRRE